MANINIKEYGWAIHLGVLPYKEDAQEITLTFNLVRPGATDKVDANETVLDWIQDDTGPVGECEDLKNDPLMFPWKWSELKWVIYDGTTPLKIQLNILNSNSVYGVKDVLEDEIIAKTTGCNSPFSVKLNDSGKVAASYPHALAPLTHLPEPISGDELKMSGFLKVNKNDLNDIINNSKKISIFPNAFNIDTKTKLELNYVVEKGGYSKSIYQKIVAKPNVAFYCNSILIPKAVLSGNNNVANLSLASTPDSSKSNRVRNTAIRYLNPLSVIKSFLAKNLNQVSKDNIADYKKHLIKYIGLGWEISRKVKTNSASNGADTEIYPHVFDFLFDKTPAEIEQLNNKYFREAVITKLINSDAAALNAIFNKLILESAKLSDVLYKNLLLLNTVTNPNQLTQTWVDIANMAEHDEQGKIVYAVFWSVLLNYLSSDLANVTPIKVTPEEILAKINNDFIQRSKAALILQGYVNYPDPQYGLIDKLVTKGEIPIDVNTAILELSHLFVGIPIENTELKAYYNIAFAQNLIYIDENKPKSVNHDHGISLIFNSDSKDMEIRGYAIALQSGIKQDVNKIIWDTDRASWITDVKVYLKDSQIYINRAMHETVGATLFNGVAVVEREYTGRPLNAHLVETRSTDDNKTIVKYLEAGSKNEEFDHTDALDYIWPIDDNLPLLGYGMYYYGLATPIGNAGEVINPEYRSDHKLSELLAASSILNKVENSAAHRYLSKVLPGRPMLLNANNLIELQEISEDTKAHAYQTSTDLAVNPTPTKEIHPVSLLIRDNTFFMTGKNSTTLSLTSPNPSAEFFTRWLNTDLSRVKLLKFEQIDSEFFQNYVNSDSDSVKKLKSIVDNQVALLASEKDRLTDIQLETWNKFKAFHPAIKKLYVSVAYNGSTALETNNFFLDLGHKIESNYFKAESVNFIIKTDERDSKVETNVIKIKDGDFAKIIIYCVIEKELFDDGIKKRFDTDLHSASKLEISDAGKAYYAFSPLELWFEAAPKWEDPFVESDSDILSIISTSDTAQLKFKTDINANWIKSTYIERHEWHWTGYPVDFPQAIVTDLKPWLNSFVGVESFRDSHTQILTTIITNTAKWQIEKSQVLDQYLLGNGSRPAKYLAYTLRPIVRFSKWLKKERTDQNTIPLDIESKVFAVGKLIKGISPANANERISVPPLKWSIPLTATYGESAKNLPERIANGNMLIFDEAIRRTDSLTKFGGIGDSLEIDLMETRISTYPEIGVNPIFHGFTDVNPNITLEYDKPFGLTYDTSSNAKVVQTGIVVRPKSAGGKWILAKVKARRLILPETIENSNLKDDNILKLRQVGDEYIPMDFCVDATGEDDLSKITSINLNNTKIKTPNFIKIDWKDGKPTRLLCSFHKGDWGKGETSWRMQIHAQKQSENYMEWKTVAKQSCFDSVIIPSFIVGCEPLLSVHGEDNSDVTKNYFLSIIRMSDYTDPIWLTFIGSFGLEAIELGKADDYDLVIHGNKLNLQIKNNTKKNNALKDVLKCIPSSRDDITKTLLFHMLMIFKPISDIAMSNAVSIKDGGQFLDFYKYEGKNIFGKLDDNNAITSDGHTLNGHYAYLCTFQIASSISISELSQILEIKSSSALIELMFPKQENEIKELLIKESLIRLVPEYLGPIKIT